MIDAAATLVWLAPEPPTTEQARALTDWAYAHGVRLSSPASIETSPQPAGADVADVADRIETLLDEAHEAVTARDGAGADRALTSAGALLFAHPELPQASWLMAEVERARAAAWRRIAPIDREAADRAWRRADALDGGRAAGVGEESSGERAAPASLLVHVRPVDAVAWLDGRTVTAAPVATRAGLHALVVAEEGAAAWARWIEVRGPSSTLDVHADAPSPCSAPDMAPARLAEDGTTDARHVRCSDWIAAWPGSASGVIQIRRCEADRCGPRSEWRPRAPHAWLPPDRARPASRWPTWATWTLVGAGAAVTSAIVLLASGALQPASTQTRFVVGGVKPQ